MNQFSISQLSQFSGIKPHTIRIWEQRYNALKPHRSEGNTRFYDGEQLRRLLNIVSLSRTEKISKICAMSDEELFEIKSRYIEQAVSENDYSYFISQLIGDGINYDEAGFEKIFSECVTRFGFTTTYKSILYPVMVRVGLMWNADFLPPAQEHFLTNLIKQKIYAAIDAMGPSKENEETWLLFLPEEEFHDLGLLFGNYFIRSQGENVIFLGANVPVSAVEKVLENLRIDNILTFFVHQNLSENFEQYISNLHKIGADSRIHIAGDHNILKNLEVPNGVHKLTSVEELENRFQKQENL